MCMRLLVSLVLTFFCAVSMAEKDEFSLNLNNVDIHALIETVADATGKNFIVDPRITGNISVVTSTPMKASQVYDVFLSILKVHGFSAIPNGNIVKIIPNITAKQDGEESELRARSLNGDEQLTRIVQVHHVDATMVVTTLLPLMPQYAFMAAVPESNTIILSDTAANVNRLASMIKQIDTSDAQKIEIISLRNANATDLIQPLNTLIASTNAGKTNPGGPPLVADDRSNSIIIGGAPDLRLQLRALIANLDTPIEKDGDTDVIYLHYAVAKELVETLTGVGEKKDGNSNQPKTQATTEKTFDIRADDATNSLIITAPNEKMRSLKSVVKQLDIRRAQVHIEAIIAEVNYEKDQNVGVEWHTKLVENGVAVNSSPISLGDMASSVGKGLSVGYLVGSELRALLTAFAKDNNVNVLSTPSIVTLDNEEASMLVGQNVPILSGSFTAGAGSAANAVNTYTRQDVGTMLKVTPQINEGNAIKLKVKQEVSSVETTDTKGGGGATLNKREIDTSVLVDDGKILVLGGLIGDDVQVTVNKVPFLGDLPFLGFLFQSNSTKVVKTNLMVFLRPVIMRDPEKASLFTNDRYNALRNNQEQSGKRGLMLMPNEHAPILPELTPDIPNNPVTSQTIK
ncbi:type II secretion system secretin GspD [Methylobacter sp. S3L5C]|uniref:type II secretion system secretin GspD n=1 Tax=Methylobacter sp. S3L5C TaxID=2839024 RepID=UPI001FAB8186|nr:type II secretion system secretin GspD [Methylobacter sp. S3L5C]UOA10523.1 type II secretion system secretin GspD [Methylobacter sp. S3L5C]